jgi:MoaE-MoaD fusion protein
MKIRVLFFGLMHDVTGFEQEEVELRDGESVASLWRRYENRFPGLAEISGSLMVAVNQNVVESSRTLAEGDEVAFLPPVSGGSAADLYRITRDIIPVAQISSQFRAAEDGAVVAFEGIVRKHSQGRRTLYLDYEAYEPMAIRIMQEIGEEARKRFPVSRVAIIHRIGRLEIGETSVLIVTASAHRAAAFDGCRYAIDELKRRVPIWKKEQFEEGSEWAESGRQENTLAGVFD